MNACPHTPSHGIVGRNCSAGFWVCRNCGRRHPDCCAMALPACPAGAAKGRPQWMGCDLVRETAALAAGRAS
jgi:hypothetical protein